MLKKISLFSFIFFIVFFVGFLTIEEKSPLFGLFFFFAVLSFLVFFASFSMFILINIGNTLRRKNMVNKEKYVRITDKSTGETIDRINIQTTGVKKEEEMKRIFKEVIEKGYTDDKYDVNVVSDQKKEVKTSSSAFFTIEASAKNILMVNIFGIITGSILLLIMMFLRNIYMIGLLLFGISVLIIYMVSDYLIWVKKGIRKIEIDENGINFYFGKENRLVRVEKQEIKDVDIFSKLNRRILNIVLQGGNVLRLPGMTFFSGDRIRIPEDAFNEKEFTELLRHFENFKK